LGAAALWRSRGSGFGRGGAGEPGSCWPLFIGAERRFGRPIFFKLEELMRPAMVVRERSWRGLGLQESRPIRRCGTRPLVQGASWPWRRGVDGGGSGVGGDVSGRSL
jgi:hypothetical protein